MTWTAGELSLVGEMRRAVSPPPFSIQLCAYPGCMIFIVRPRCGRALLWHSNMARLRIKERVKRKERALAYLQLRSCSAMYSQMWFWANLGFLYTLGQLTADDTPTQQPTRDIFTFLSAQDCINLLRFSQDQVGVCLVLAAAAARLYLQHEAQRRCDTLSLTRGQELCTAAAAAAAFRQQQQQCLNLKREAGHKLLAPRRPR